MIIGFLVKVRVCDDEGNPGDEPMNDEDDIPGYINYSLNIK